MNPLPLPPTIRWEGSADGRLWIIEQTLLPAEEREIPLDTVDEVIDAMRRLAVRGAPAIGVTAAYAVVVAAGRRLPAPSPEAFFGGLREDLARLASARPTAVNLSWAVRRMATVIDAWEGPPDGLSTALLAEARAVHDEDAAACEAMARYALDLVSDGSTYLTHCNAGALATGGIGTALGVFHLAAREGLSLRVFADETRPLLQGARLTAWELARSGVEVTVICDSAAAGLLARGEIDAVFVGSDRIAANGDVANKVGTLSVALAAHDAGVPFFVVAPTSTFDLETSRGAGIVIEDRPGSEVTEGFGPRTAPAGVPGRNPAFDVTPARLVTAIVTEVGLVRPVSETSVRELLA